MKDQNTDIAAMTFEVALKELEAIVRKLENGQGSLDGAIADYARGTELREHCQKKLSDARLKVEKIVKSAGGELRTEAFDGA